jgi:hypothetical protein
MSFSRIFMTEQIIEFRGRSAKHPMDSSQKTNPTFSRGKKSNN